MELTHLGQRDGLSISNPQSATLGKYFARPSISILSFNVWQHCLEVMVSNVDQPAGHAWLASFRFPALPTFFLQVVLELNALAVKAVLVVVSHIDLLLCLDHHRRSRCEVVASAPFNLNN